jgi:hypothetical protein
VCVLVVPSASVTLPTTSLSVPPVRFTVIVALPTTSVTL